MELFQQIEFHNEIQKRQRDSYSQNIKDEQLLKNNLVIEMDFKAKIVLGKYISKDKIKTVYQKNGNSMR